MGVVQHARNAIEAEAVELVLREPPLNVGQQEPQHLASIGPYVAISITFSWRRA